MSMPAEHSTNLASSWEGFIAQAVAPLEPHIYGTTTGFDLDCLLPHNISIQSFQPPGAPDSSALDHLHNLPRPYATNWSTCDNYNHLAGGDLHTTKENSELGHRVRVNSIASSASSFSYSIHENQANCLPGILQEASEAHVGHNGFYQPSLRSSSEVNFAPNYDQRMPLQPHPTFFEQAQSMDLGLASSRSFTGCSETRLPNIPNKSKVTSYCLDRPYQCGQCGSSFSRNHDLKRHSRIHLNVKPFPCSFCDKAFARKDALKRHLLVKGCSQSKQCPAGGSSRNERHKPVTPARKNIVEQSQSPRSSPKRNEINGQRDSSVPHYQKGKKTEAIESFGEIQLQHIQCAMSNFL